MVTLNVALNGTERLALVNGMLNNSITYNDSYSLIMIQMGINPATNILRKKEQKEISFYFISFL